jgi:5'-nucleotidase
MRLSRLALLAALFLLPVHLSADYTLTLLHFNDAESHLLNAGDPETDPATVPTANANDLANYGGASRFVTLLKSARAEATTDAVLTISAGDNFQPGLVLDASDPVINEANKDGVNYDARVFAKAAADVTVLGNHDFDLGPDYLAGFLDAVHKDDCPMRTVSCNLDASAVPALAKNLAPSTVLELGKEKVGVVGATIWYLANLSNPGKVVVIDADHDGDTDIDDTALLVQKEIDTLTKQGVNKIILVSHLQNIRNDQALIRKLRGVDIGISGGGHELLASGSYDAIPGATPPRGDYPLVTGEDGQPLTDLDGRNVPVVSAGCGLNYLGRLVVRFDDAGNLLEASGGPLLVNALGERAEVPDAVTDQDVINPVYSYIQAYGSKVAAQSDVALDALRTHVRNAETNLGDLVADALLHGGRVYAARWKLTHPDVAVLNGGSIRCNSIVQPGNLTNISLKNIIPFTNRVALVNQVTPEEFKALAEHMIGEAGSAGGRFGQIAGFRMVYDAKAPVGQRIITLVLDDGREIVRDGGIAPEAPTVTFATVDFLARGGDNYPFNTAHVGHTDVQQFDALRNYVAEDLKGRITAARYPEGGLGRILTK